MALRDLVEGDCGGPSPLIRLASHFVQDHGLKEEGVRDLFGPTDPFETANSDQLVKQFLEDTAVHPQTFKMENLLQEMRDIDQSIYPPVTAPGIVEELTGQDTAWANQYLQSGRHFDVCRINLFTLVISYYCRKYLFGIIPVFCNAIGICTKAILMQYTRYG